MALEILTIKLVLLIIALTWHYSLLCGYVSDDHATIEQRKDIIPEGEKNPRKENYWLKVFNDGIIMYYMTRLFWKLFGYNSFFWHLMIYLMHLLNCFLLWKVLLNFVDNQTACAIVLIWGVNPMLNQVVVWCSGRPYSIITTLALTMMLYYKNIFINIILYIVGVVTSMTMGLVPVIMYIMRPNLWQSKLMALSIVLAIPFIFWKFSQRFGKGALVLDREYYKFKLKRINCVMRMYVYYITTLLFPTKMGWYHEAGFRYNPKWEGFNYTALIGYITTFLLIKYNNFGGIWFLLGMLPNMNLFATNSFLQDRYIYFGSIGLFIFLSKYYAQFPIAFIALVAVYISKSYSYSRQMVNDEKLYRENWRNHPKSDYAINNLAFFLIQQYRYEEARAIIKRGLDISNQNKLLWYNLGITWAAQGHLQSQEGKFRFLRAMDCWKMALNLEPRWAKPREDLEKLTRFLLENKVLTTKKEEAANSSPIHVPINIGALAQSATQEIDNGTT